MDLIPTQHKDKLPQGFSYPIGAKELSEALADAPQHALMALSFHDRDTFWASEFKDRIKKKGTIKVIEIEYCRSHAYPGAPQYFVESGHFEPKWKICVYALPSEHRHDVNTALIELAMPVYKEWLQELGNLDAYTLHRKSFGFDLTQGSLSEI